MRRGLTPPPPVEADPYAAAAPMLPTSLAEAVKALEGDAFYRSVFGDTFVDYLLMMKRAEIKRYEAALAEAGATDSPSEVSDWEMREYFEFF
jgi:glutamine synthetase